MRVKELIEHLEKSDPEQEIEFFAMKGKSFNFETIDVLRGTRTTRIFLG